MNMDENTGVFYGIVESVNDKKNVTAQLSVSDGITTVIQDLNFDLNLLTYSQEKFRVPSKPPTSYSTYLKGKMSQGKKILNKNISNDHGWSMSKVRRLRRVGSAAPLKKSQVCSLINNISINNIFKNVI